MGIWGYHSLDVQHVILLFSMAHSTTRWWCAAGSNDKRLPLGIHLPFGEHLDLIAQREYNPAYIKYSIHIWIHWITLKYKYNVHMSHMYITMAIGTSLHLYISHILITHRHSISARSSAWCSSWRALDGAQDTPEPPGGAAAGRLGAALQGQPHWWTLNDITGLL